jgi:hypothetical protein
MFRDLMIFIVVLVSMVWTNCFLYAALKPGDMEWNWWDLPPLLIGGGIGLIAGLLTLIIYVSLLWRAVAALLRWSERIPARLSYWVRSFLDPEWRAAQALAKKQQALENERLADQARKEKLSEIARRCKAERLAKTMAETENETDKGKMS